MIPRDVIDEIKKRLDIVDVVSEYMSLERVGSNYRALCPFHVETRPSFYVSPKLQMYHCFGCGAKGDVIKFVQEMENISFSEALEKLAEKAGIDLSPYRKGKSFFSLYVSFLEKLKKRYMEKLFENIEAMEYLERRGISTDDIEKFELGYSPEDFDVALDVASEMSIEIGTLHRFGVFSGNRDLFRGRITFPIKNDSGSTVAFGGRVLDDSEPKYVNSKDTKYFSKSRILYLLDRAKSSISSGDLVIITEGYMDAIAFHRAGFDNAVAVLGTALTRYHAMKLSTLTKNAVLAFDSDKSGVKAALRSISVLLDHGFEILVVDFGELKDADEVLKVEGEKGLERRLENAVEFERYIPRVLSGGFDLSRQSGAEKFAEVLKRWKDRFEELGRMRSIDAMIDEASNVSGLDKTTLRRMMEGAGKVRREEVERRIGEEELLVYLYINHEDLRGVIRESLRGLEDILSERMKEFLENVDDEALNISLERLSKDTGDWIFGVLRDVPPANNPEKVFEDVIKKLQKKKLRKRMREIDELINRVSDEEKDVLLKTRMELLRKLKAL